MDSAAQTSSGLASRRAAGVTPLMLNTTRANVGAGAGAPTPRSSLLAGLRTAPKTSTATNFPLSPTTVSLDAYGRPTTRATRDVCGINGPRTAHPFYGGNSHQATFASASTQYDTDYAKPMVDVNLVLLQQRQQLEQQMMNLRATMQQLQLNSAHGNMTLLQQQQYYMLAAQQQQLAQMQQQLAATQVPGIITVVDPSTGQRFWISHAQAAQLGYAHATTDSSMGPVCDTPTVQVSPPTGQPQQQPQQSRAHQGQGHHGFSSGTPLWRQDSSSTATDTTALPPPSSNAFRRGHKKVPSLAITGSPPTALGNDVPLSAGPRTSSFPQTGQTGLGGSYGPGHRAGEHPYRQPRLPPSMEELLAKPTVNFATRARRSAVFSLVRAGIGRRNGTSSSLGSVATSPTSEVTEEAGSPTTDVSDSELSGSGSLVGDIESSLPDSGSTPSPAWGAIGSDRPSSRQKSRQSVDNGALPLEGESDTFANVFKNAQRASKEMQRAESPMNARKLVLTKSGVTTAA